MRPKPVKKLLYQDYTCKRCGNALKVPYGIQGQWRVYKASVRCKCGDISKQFFESVIDTGFQWKWGKLPNPEKEPKPSKPKKPKVVRKKRVLKVKGKTKVPEIKENVFTKHGCSPREAMVIQALLKGASKKDALISAGYSESLANSAPDRIVGKSRVQQTMLEILEDQGVTDSRLAAKVSEGLDAKKVISAMVIAPDGEGMKDASTMTKDFIEVDDYDAQHKFLVTGLKLRGHLQTSQGAGPAPGSPETYEQWRERMGLNRMTPQEALDKLMEEKAALLAREEAEGDK